MGHSKTSRTLNAKISKDIMYCLNKTFGDPDEQISKKTGLSRSLISSVKREEKELTYEQMREIEKGYGIPRPIILLKSIEQRKISKDMEKFYQAMRKLLISNAEMDEEFGGIKYGNWRELI